MVVLLSDKFGFGFGSKHKFQAKKKPQMAAFFKDHFQI